MTRSSCEAFARILALSTFTDELDNCYMTNLVDNDAVLFSMIKGTAQAGDSRAVVGRMWMAMARKHVAWMGYRVESHSNMADAPTRDRWHIFGLLRAQLVEPVWPHWLFDLWQPLMPAHEVSQD